VTDVWRFKVYNTLTFPLLGAGLLYHAAVGGTAGLSHSFTGLLFGLGVLLVPYTQGWMGAGDVKFVAAVGAWLGLEPMVSVLVIGGLATGLYSSAVIVYHGGYRQAWVNLQLAVMRLTLIGKHFGADDDVETVQAMAKEDNRRQRLIPFSAMITVGVITTYVWSTWLR
jgi:Flp pilus assembly protein protease CpaA